MIQRQMFQHYVVLDGIFLGDALRTSNAFRWKGMEWNGMKVSYAVKEDHPGRRRLELDDWAEFFIFRRFCLSQFLIPNSILLDSFNSPKISARMRQFLTFMVRSVRSTPIHEAIIGIQVSLANEYRDMFILPLISCMLCLNLPISPQRRISRYSITVYMSLVRCLFFDGQHMLTKISVHMPMYLVWTGRHHLKVGANDPPTHEYEVHSLVKSQQEAKEREGRELHICNPPNL